MTPMHRVSSDLRRQNGDLEPQQIRRILIVRSVFRIVSVDLGMPAIQLLHKNFPAAQIEHNFRLAR